MAEIADVLRVPVGYFFSGMTDGAEPADRGERELQRHLRSSETIELLRAYYAIPHEELRRAFFAVVTTAATSRRS